jgi:hypothetical protein
MILLPAKERLPEAGSIVISPLVLAIIDVEPPIESL